MKKSLKARLSILLALIMLLTSVIPVTSMAENTNTDPANPTIDTSKLPSGSILTSQTNYPIASGITETDLILNNAQGTNQKKAFVLTVNLNNSTTGIVASYNDHNGKKLGLQSTRDQAAAYTRDTGVKVVGGVNASFFNMQTGAPSGLFIMDGVKYQDCDSNYRGVFAIMKDGSYRIFPNNPDSSVISDIEQATAGIPIVINSQFTSAVTENSYATGSDVPRTAVGVKPDGEVVFYVVDGRQAPSSCGQTYAEVANTMMAMGCTDVINFDGGGSSTFLSRREGEELDCHNSPSDGNERRVSSSFLITSTAKPSGTFDHAVLLPNNKYYTPGSEIQFTASGVDSSGAAVSLPENGKFVLDEQSESGIGSIDENTGLFKADDKKTGKVVVDYIVDGKITGSISNEIVIPEKFYVPSQDVSLGYDVDTTFSLQALYKSIEVNQKDGDIVWTAVDSSGNDIIDKAFSSHDGLTLHTIDSTEMVQGVLTATSKFNESVKSDINIVIGAKPNVLYDFEYTTDESAKGTDKYVPSLSFPNIYQDGYPTYVSIYQAGYPLAGWINTALNDRQNSMKVSAVSSDDGEPVRFGNKSLRIDFDFTSYNASSNANFYLRDTHPDTFYGKPTAIGCWIYIPEGALGNGVHLYLNCGVYTKTDATDPEAQYNEEGKLYYKYNKFVYKELKVDTNKSGWQYCEMDLTSDEFASLDTYLYQGAGLFWVSFQRAGSAENMPTAAHVYLDNWTLIYGANTDDTGSPEITSVNAGGEEIKDGETVLTSNTNTFKASYKDAEGKYATGIDDSACRMLIDGVDVTSKCYVNEPDDEMYYYDAQLPNGVHSITIQAADKFGNVSTVTRDFTVKSDEEQTIKTAEFKAVDDNPVLGRTYSMNVSSDDISSLTEADVSVKILSSFVKYWRDFTVTPSANYELDGTPHYSDINDTINFKVKRKADADTSKDDGTAATLSINVPADVPEDTSVTYKIQKGALTFSDGTLGSFGGIVTSKVDAPLHVTSDVFTVGQENANFYVKDSDGNPVTGAYLYNSADNSVIGTTDSEGKVTTALFLDAVTSFSVYAKKDTDTSFIYTSQSYKAGGKEDASPMYVVENASKNPSTTQSFGWYANPLKAKHAALALYAEKSAYDKDGESAFKTVEGRSVLTEMKSSGSASTNYTVLENTVTITGLKPDTEYVAKVGDGETFSDIKTFTTDNPGVDTNFFVIGDTQANDTTNTDLITKYLSESGVKYAFGTQLGDACDNGGDYGMWTKINKVFSDGFLGNTDTIHVLGNHEYYGDDNAINAANYFDFPGKTEEKAPIVYSVTYGNVYVAVVDYCTSASDYQKAADWIKSDAANAKSVWKILVMHQPIYYTNPGVGNEKLHDIFVPMIDEVGIDFVFAGHDHSYARTKAMIGDKLDSNGTTYVISGSTGEKSYSAINNPAFNFEVIRGKDAAEEYNATFITVNATDTEFTMTTYDMTGSDESGNPTVQILDSYTKKKTECTHDYVLNGDKLICDKCGKQIGVSGYTGFLKTTDGNVRYYIDGAAKKGWFTHNDKNYYFNDEGNAVDGSQQIDGYNYTFKDHILVRGDLVQITKNHNGVDYKAYGYIFAGQWQKGWIQIDDDWYYFYWRLTKTMPDGSKAYLCATNRKPYATASGKFGIKDSGSSYTYYYTFDKNGKYVTGAFVDTDEGTFYAVEEFKKLYGWQTINGKTYYFDPETGYEAKGDVVIDGQSYHFSSEGVLNGAEPSTFGIKGFWQRFVEFINKIVKFFYKLTHLF